MLAFSFDLPTFLAPIGAFFVGLYQNKEAQGTLSFPFSTCCRFLFFTILVDLCVGRTFRNAKCVRDVFLIGIKVYKDNPKIIPAVLLWGLWVPPSIRDAGNPNKCRKFMLNGIVLSVRSTQVALPGNQSKCKFVNKLSCTYCTGRKPFWPPHFVPARGRF